MPDGKLDPTGDRAERFRRVLVEWLAGDLRLGAANPETGIVRRPERRGVPPSVSYPFF
jgi:hypothetical protein